MGNAQRLRRWCVVVLAAGLLAGCARDSGVPPIAEPAPPGFPVTLDNCGVSTKYDRPPRRAVTLNQHATEILLALGLQGSMRGTAFLDDRVRPEYRAAYDSVPVLADEYPSYEALLSVEPDFVYGGYASAFDEKEGRGRQRLADAGVATHLNIEDCAGGPVPMRLLDDEIRSIGTIFGVADRAEREIDRLHRTLADVDARTAGVAPVRVAVYDSGEHTAFTAGGHGVGSEMITRAGGLNLFADVPKAFADVSFEQFAARSPDAVLIYDYGDQTVEQKKQFLLQNPVLQHVPAIRDRRFVVLPLSAAVLGVRVPGATAALARQLHPDLFG